VLASVENGCIFVFPNNETMTKRITLSTVKSFIRNNEGNMFIKVKSSYDPMMDGISYEDKGFAKAKQSEGFDNNTLGISGAWFVGNSRDWFTAYEDDKFTGIIVSNCCGSFILAAKKQGVA